MATTPKPLSKKLTAKLDKITVGMPADDVLKLIGPGKRSRKLGKDHQGYIVEWVYPWGSLIFKRGERDNLICYRVAEKRL